MADPRVLSKRNAYARSEAGDAASSSAQGEGDRAGEPASPLLRSGPAAPPAAIPLPASSSPSHPPVHTIPVITGAAPQANAAGMPHVGSANPAGEPDLALDPDAGVLTINRDFSSWDAQIPDLLKANPNVRHVLFQSRTLLAMAIDGIKLVSAVPQVTSVTYARQPDADLHRLLSAPDYSGGGSLGSLLAGNATLAHLQLQNLPVDTTFLSLLADGLEYNTTLASLDISGAQAFGRIPIHDLFSSDLGPGFAAIISQGKGLATLRAAWQSIADAGAVTIAKALEKNTSLKTLVLANNDLGAKGCKALFKSIAKNKKTALIALDLAGNQVDTHAARSLGALLKKNTSLKEIVIGTVADTESLKHILGGLKKNESIQSLRFDAIQNPDGEYRQYWREIDDNLKRRVTSAAGQPGATTDTAGNSTTGQATQARSVPGPG